MIKYVARILNAENSTRKLSGIIFPAKIPKLEALIFKCSFRLTAVASSVSNGTLVRACRESLI